MAQPRELLGTDSPAHRRRNNARIDGLISLGVIPGAALVAAGPSTGDPLIGLAITLVILKITWDSWRIVSTTDLVLRIPVRS